MLLFLLLPIVFAACMNTQEENETYLHLEASQSLTTFQKIHIQIGDTLGNRPTTLYNDTLPSIKRLTRLPAGPYRGGFARITIHGYRGDKVAYREVRMYNGTSQKVLSVEVLHDNAIPLDTNAASDLPVSGLPIHHAPTLASFPSDTSVSIRDSVPLFAEAVDIDGNLAGYAWDCNGDGQPEESADLAGFRSKIPFARLYSDSGTRTCQLRVWDQQTGTVEAAVVIRVFQDPPKAEAGRDTTVVMGTTIYLHAKGEDGFGPIYTREWKIGSESFKHVTQQESTILAPAELGDLECILRVTDSDGLAGLDTLIVHVIGPQ